MWWTSQQALQDALRDNDVRTKLSEAGARPFAVKQATPEARRTFWQADIAKSAPIIWAAGQYAD